MTPRRHRTRSFGLPRVLPVVLALTALLAVSVQLVAADGTNVSLAKASTAVGLQGPSDTYSYTVTAEVGAQPVTELRIQDGSLDYPQISVTGASYSINGGASVDCATGGGNAGPSDVDCRVGSAAANATVVVTIQVAVASNVQVACDDPGLPGALDDDIRNRATVAWRDADNAPPAALWLVQSNLVVTDLDCDGYVPGTPAPDTTITAGPAAGSTTTSTSASFSFTGTNSPTLYECKLDAGAYATCTSPKAYSGLSVGSHTFSVRAVNATGPDPTPATRTWTIEAAASHPFTDIDASPFKDDIIWLYNEGITTGCSATLFCPTGNVTRAQMASFLVRALDLPATATDYFSDDNGNFHEDDINALAAAGITDGCGGGRYCPNSNVLRDQMASFLVRAYDFAPSATNFFTDDNGNFHEANINALAAAGVTNGCGGGKYCPSSPVSREQMAAFLHRAVL